MIKDRRVVFGTVLTAIVVLSLAGWAIAIGPQAVQRVLVHGTTTVWDHQVYPGRDIAPSPNPRPWSTSFHEEPSVTLDGASLPISEVLAEHASLGMLIIQDGDIVYEWYAPEHDQTTATMLFSVTKSITSLLIGIAIDDGLINSVEDSITAYIPELSTKGFDGVTIADALRMETNSNYVENDNPFGVHVRFNYTPHLEADILSLRVRDEPDRMFTYKSGDNAILGLILQRVLAPESITEYLQRRLLDPLGAEHGGTWSTDTENGLERTWCCLALSARDLARIGQLIVDGGRVGDTQLVAEDWLRNSFAPAYTAQTWPAEYRGTALTNYGYQWWLTTDGVVALGKGGQYLYVDTTRDIVIVRAGTSQGGIGWLDILGELAHNIDDQQP